MDSTNSDPRFDYTQPVAAGLSVSQLDAMAEFVTTNNGGGGMFSAIIAGLKLLVVSAYFIARKAMIDQAMALQKQQYEGAQASHNQNEVNQPDPK